MTTPTTPPVVAVGQRWLSPDNGNVFEVLAVNESHARVILLDSNGNGKWDDWSSPQWWALSAFAGGWLVLQTDSDPAA